jgi:phosphonopyruvate decarboxylase
VPSAETAFRILTDAGITFWAGVPDSLLKPLCAYVADHVPSDRHVIAANEGGAVALAAGHYLASGSPGAVYLQNSGLGNAMNPLISLADAAVYGIPMLLIIGWRGEPGHHDEPQHLKQGTATIPMLDAIDVPTAIAPADDAAFAAMVARSVDRARAEGRPVAIVVPKGVIGDYRPSQREALDLALSREAAIAIVAESIHDDAAIVATTGKASRELYEYRTRSGNSTERDFLTVGSMGHASQIALGLALTDPTRPVWVLDGDGAVIMHMGALSVIGEHAPANLKHVVLNNHVHDSVGGQPTPSEHTDFARLALAAGYRVAETAADEAGVVDAVTRFSDAAGPALLEVIVRPGARSNLGRPKTSPRENRDALMQWLRR